MVVGLVVVGDELVVYVDVLYGLFDVFVCFVVVVGLCMVVVVVGV